MDFHTFLLLIVGGVLSSSLVIVCVFIIINMCIKLKAAKYAAKSTNHTKSSYEMATSFKYNGQEDVRPPLPPRDQFDTESLSNSYEEVPENPVVTEETSPLQNPVMSHPPETRIDFEEDNNSASENYDDVDDLQNSKLQNDLVRYNSEEVASLPDYLEVEPVPLRNESDSGSENYDDIEELHNDNEDYDDVG